ncbi:ribbon-helix-helix protein, CopG family [Saccharolobus islandicus]|uniref:CopG domain protein DNA-binding domain protein n=1 Tax=Saccharolobus islandicus (strain L.D.8.5 / Lassen \|nr:ribbon-helix-helix protein, CopG family [Sulfolobus islandicus]ADB87175.1 CopG domain protein DNA-binding domain protein [Sulfolobus islandicus L.D.8.5]
MRIVTFKIDEQLLQQLDLYCINNAKERSEVIREAIKLYLLIKKKSTLIEENKNNEVRVREI